MARIEEYFPYKPRPYQKKLIAFLKRSLSRGVSRICIHAPTGFGKTPVILSVLTSLMNRGVRVVWAVRTGNETDRPIEELKTIVEKFDLNIFALSYRGKRDMCLLSRKLGLPSLSHEETTYLCKSLKRRCKYFEAVRYVDVLSMVEEPLTYNEILKKCVKEGVCPYYTQRVLLEFASMVSLSYNYVVDKRISWSIARLFPFNHSVLVVDEAHNLQNINLNSDRITEGTLLNAIKEAEEYSLKNVIKALTQFQTRFYKLKKNMKEGELEEVTFEPLSLIKDLLDYIPKIKRWGEIVRRDKLEEGKAPRSSLYHFAEFWERCEELVDTKGITFVATLENDRLVLEIWDMRSSEVLSECWNRFLSVIFCSGTLKPISAFADIVGLSNYAQVEVPSIYSKDNVRAVILSDVSTRGEEISTEMCKKYVDAIRDFIEALDTNIAVFVSSYRVLESLIKEGLIRKLTKLKRKVFIERRNMRGDEAREILEKFKKCATSDVKGVLVGVMGGRFAEGADFPGRELEGVFLVGIPFDKPTARVREYIKYYQELYGEDKGYFYSYILPALRRASQAIGRALRSMEDRAMIVCGDYRYLNYLDLLPDYVRENLRRATSEELFELATSFNDETSH